MEREVNQKEATGDTGLSATEKETKDQSTTIEDILKLKLEAMKLENEALRLEISKLKKEEPLFRKLGLLNEKLVILSKEITGNSQFYHISFQGDAPAAAGNSLLPGFAESFGSGVFPTGEQRNESGDGRDSARKETSDISRRHSGMGQTHSGMERPNSATSETKAGMGRTYDGREKAHDGGEKISPGMRKDYDGMEKIKAGVEKAHAGVEKTCDGMERSFDGGEKTYDSREQTNDSREKAYDGMEKAYDGMEYSDDLMEKVQNGAEMKDSVNKNLNLRGIQSENSVVRSLDPCQISYDDRIVLTFSPDNSVSVNIKEGISKKYKNSSLKRFASGLKNSINSYYEQIKGYSGVSSKEYTMLFLRVKSAIKHKPAQPSYPLKITNMLLYLYSYNKFYYDQFEKKFRYSDRTLRRMTTSMKTLNWIGLYYGGRDRYIFIKDEGMKFVRQFHKES